MGSLRTFTIRFFTFLNIGVGILFLLACCNAWLHPEKWWLIAMLAFIFPILLLLLLLLMFFWLIAAPRLALISLLCLIIGWKNIHAFYGFNPAPQNFSVKETGSIRIMTWNVRSWDEFSTRRQSASGHRLPMLELVGKQKADILCFQEFYEPADSARSNIRYIRKTLGYPFVFFSRDYHNHLNKYESGSIIFSRFPMVATSQLRFGTDSIRKTGSLIYADLDINGKIVRVYTTHLQSVLFKPRDFHNVEIIRNAEDSMIEASRSIVKKLKSALALRGHQADTVRKELDKCPYPLVICGDFNDVPNSYVYFHIRGNLRDAFTEKCFGVGRTYIYIAPTLRIDYILPSKNFTVLQTMKFAPPYSDHHAVLTDLRLQD